MTAAPNDTDIIQEFIRVDLTPTERTISVLDIGWDGPHTPVGTWIVVGRLSRVASTAETEKAVRRVLHSPRWFRLCQTCRQRKPKG